MQVLAVLGLSFIGMGILMSVLGALRGMVAVSPVVAYASGQRADLSAQAARHDPKRVIWSRVLLAGVLAIMLGAFLLTFVQ